MIGIIDYGSGNTRSVQNALERMDAEYVLTDDTDALDARDKIIFPGVGAAGSAMSALRDRKLFEWIRNCDKPFLGICLGMQLLFDSSEEGSTSCLGVIPGKVRKFSETKKIPHMGWNRVLSRNLAEFDQEYFYFAHSYFAPVGEFTVAACEYGDETFSAIARKDNFWGTQFHPEKSGDKGELLISYFLQNG